MIAVEPNPYSNRLIKFNFNLNSFSNSNLYIESSAIADKDDMMTMFLPAKDSWNGGTMAFKSQQQNENIESVDVKTLTIKSLIKKYNFENIGFIRIDSQGFEHPILSNLFSMNLQNLPILSFCSTVRLYQENGFKLEDTYKMLIKNGYKVFQYKKHFDSWNLVEIKQMLGGQYIAIHLENKNV